MELVVKHFSELSAEELFEIYKLRVSVFVVEQKCFYQEVDDADPLAYHIWLKDEDGMEAYARVLGMTGVGERLSGGGLWTGNCGKAPVRIGKPDRGSGHPHR